MTTLALIPVIGSYLASLWIVVQSINKRIDGLDASIGSLDTRIGSLETSMRDVQRLLGVLEERSAHNDERTAHIVSMLERHDAMLHGRET